MKGLLKRLNTAREGATMITVVIATAFLIAIGVVILAASTKYLASVYMDRNSNENLYDAEGVLAEVRSGLLEYAGDAGKEAYKEVVENYMVNHKNDIMDPLSVNAKSRFAKLYMSKLGSKLMAPMAYVCKDKSDPSCITGSATGIVTITQHQQFPVSNIACLTQFGDDLKKLSLDESEDPESPETPEEPESSDDKLQFSVYYSPSKGYYMVIENLVIVHEDDAGYRSSIDTDIQLLVPDYKFDGDAKMDEAKNYLSISDGNLQVTSLAGGSVDSSLGADNDHPLYAPSGFTRVDGNIYAGGYKGDGVTPGSITTEDGTVIGTEQPVGIIVDNNAMIHFNCEKLITRGNIELGTGSRVGIYGAKDAMSTPVTGFAVQPDTADGDLYAKNIVLKASKLNDSDGVRDRAYGTNLTLATRAKVENDLDIQDYSSTVVLGGEYFGYSYNEANNSASGIVNADYSSAILVNGLNTTIRSVDSDAVNNADYTQNMKEEDGVTPMNPNLVLKELNLSGRAFVSRTKKENNGAISAIQLPDSVSTTKDIMMGESMAVRSNQMAYLVPERCIKKIYRNPISSDDIGREMNEAGTSWTFSDDPINLVDMKELKKKAPGKDVSVYDYLNEGNPVTANYIQAGQSDVAYVYLFLNFKSQQAANEYFQHFMNDDFKIVQTKASKDNIPDDLSKSDLIDQWSTYISDGEGAGLRVSPSLYWFAGNVIYNMSANVNDTPSYQSDNYFSDADILDSVLKRGFDAGKTFVSLQKSLTTGEDVDKMRVTDTELLPLVREKMISTDEIKTYSAAALLEDGSQLTVLSSDGDDLAELDSGKITSPALGSLGQYLIISNSSTTIKTPFSGIVVAKGNVTVEADFHGLILATGSVKVNRPSLDLQSSPALVNRIYNYAMSDPYLSRVFRNMQDPETHNAVDMDKCIRYMNWTKNAY